MISRAFQCTMEIIWNESIHTLINWKLWEIWCCVGDRSGYWGPGFKTPVDQHPQYWLYRLIQLNFINKFVVCNLNTLKRMKIIFQKEISSHSRYRILWNYSLYCHQHLIQEYMRKPFPQNIPGKLGPKHTLGIHQSWYWQYVCTTLLSALRVVCNILYSFSIQALYKLRGPINTSVEHKELSLPSGMWLMHIL